jgi:hypothetical protein
MSIDHSIIIAQGTKQSNSDELLDLFATILEECGLLKRDAKENAWDKLSSSLEELAIAIENSRGASLNIEVSGPSCDLLLLELEQAAQSVRSQCESFSLEIQDRSEIIILSHEIASLCRGSQNLLKVGILVRSLVRATHQQTFRAKDAVQEIRQSLFRLHTADKTTSRQEGNLEMKLRNWAEVIRKRCIVSNSSPWSEAMEMLKLLHNDSLPEKVGFSRSWNPSEQVSKVVPSFLPRDQQAPVNKKWEDLLSATTIMAAVEIFLKEGGLEQVEATAIDATCLLVVGSAGSGKSHLCNNIQRIAGPHTYGKQ